MRAATWKARGRPSSASSGTPLGACTSQGGPGPGGNLAAGALRRAGLHADAARVARRLTRIRRVVPPLLRASIDRINGAAGAGPGETRSPDVVLGAARIGGLADLVNCRTSHRCVVALGQGLRPAVRRPRRRARRHCARVDAHPGPGAPVALVSAGGGPPTTLVDRVLRAGGVVGPAPGAHGGEEAGVAIRFGGQSTAALVARWRRAPCDAERWLSGAAAIVAGRADGWAHSLREASVIDSELPGLLGGSAAMRGVPEAIVAAPAPFAVLVYGESGVGKELIARALHDLVPGAALLRSQLRRAARPTRRIGIVRARARRLHGRDRRTRRTVRGGQRRHGLPGRGRRSALRAQAKLLRVIQQQEVRRIGEARPRPLDVRVVSAANRDPRHEAAAGAFRHDLVYRLDVIRIVVPPLRERPEDVLELADHFWRAAAGRVGSRATLGLDARSLLAASRLAGQRPRTAERTGRGRRRRAARRSSWASSTSRCTCGRVRRPTRLGDWRRRG